MNTNVESMQDHNKWTGGIIIIIIINLTVAVTGLSQFFVALYAYIDLQDLSGRTWIIYTTIVLYLFNVETDWGID